MAFEYRRRAASRKPVAKIEPENDVRVRILGTLLSKEGGKLVVDDGFGKHEIGLDADYITEVKAEEHELVEVIARVSPSETGITLQAEIITDMTGIDTELYRKVFQ